MPIKKYQFDRAKRSRKVIRKPQPDDVAAGNRGPLCHAPWFVRLRCSSCVETLREHIQLLIILFSEAPHQFTEQPIALWNRGAGND